MSQKLPFKVAKKAEESGFDSFMTYDHYMLPSCNKTYKAWILLSAISGITKKIRLGTVVTPIPFRPPGMLAKIVATLDFLSNGRVILGIGAGWHRPEFEGFSEWTDSSERVSKTEEGLKLMIELWTKEKVLFKGRYYRALGAAVIDPKPIQKPYPPLWFGTTGKKCLNLQQNTAMARSL